MKFWEWLLSMLITALLVVGSLKFLFTPPEPTAYEVVTAQLRVDSLTLDAHRRGWIAANRVWVSSYRARVNDDSARAAFSGMSERWYDLFMSSPGER